MTRLVKAAARRSAAPGATSRSSWPRGGRTGARRAASRGLVEPLSERELEVLRLLRSDLDGPEIANELVVSLNTLRTPHEEHLREARRRSRRAAVRRAEELDLLLGPPRAAAPSAITTRNHHMW